VVAVWSEQVEDLHGVGARGAEPVRFAGVLSVVFLPESRAPRARRLDLPGQALLTVAVCVSVGVIIEGPRIGWASLLAWAGYLVAAAAAAGFTWAELHRRDPLMDLGLFRRPAFTTAVLGAVAVFVALNLSLLCAPLSGNLVGRLGPRRPLFLAGMFIAAGGLSLANLGQDTNIRLLLLAYLLIGIGFGFANAPITNTAVSGLPPERSGVAGAITSSARQVGSAIGIAIAGGLVTGVTPDGLARASRPGWLIVTACGLFLFVVAQAARSAA